LAWIQHRQEMKALQAQVGAMPYSIAGIMAGLIAGEMASTTVRETRRASTSSRPLRAGRRIGGVMISFARGWAIGYAGKQEARYAAGGGM
jgi:hypothetical protein